MGSQVKIVSFSDKEVHISEKQSKTFWDYLGDFAGYIVDDFMNRAIKTAKQNNMDKKANELKGYRDKFNKWRNS